MKQQLTTIAEIKAAVDAGLDVRADNDGYKVLKNKFNHYYITFTDNGYTTGLHGLEGGEHETVLNAINFYIKE